MANLNALPKEQKQKKKTKVNWQDPSDTGKIDLRVHAENDRTSRFFVNPWWQIFSRTELLNSSTSTLQNLPTFYQSCCLGYGDSGFLSRSILCGDAWMELRGALHSFTPVNIENKAFKLHHVYICKFMLRCASTSLKRTRGDRITQKCSSKCQSTWRVERNWLTLAFTSKDNVQVGAP